MCFINAPLKELSKKNEEGLSACWRSVCDNPAKLCIGALCMCTVVSMRSSFEGRPWSLAPHTHLLPGGIVYQCYFPVAWKAPSSYWIKTFDVHSTNCSHNRNGFCESIIYIDIRILNLSELFHEYVILSSLLIRFNERAESPRLLLSYYIVGDVVHQWEGRETSLFSSVLWASIRKFWSELENMCPWLYISVLRFDFFHIGAGLSVAPRSKQKLQNILCSHEKHMY